MTFSKECEPVFLPVYQLCEHFNRPDNVDLTKTLYCHIYTKKCHVTTFFGLVVCFRICKIFFYVKNVPQRLKKKKKGGRERKKQTKGNWVCYVMNVTYVPGVLQNLGFTVVPLLIHLFNLWMNVLTELLWNKWTCFFHCQLLVAAAEPVPCVLTCRSSSFKPLNSSGGSFSPR